MAGVTKTKGTQVYYIDESGSEDEVVSIGCLTGIGEIAENYTELDVTCLTSEIVNKMNSLPDPADMALTMLFDIGNAEHRQMLANAQANTECYFAIGLSDGTEAPTAASEGFALPTTRSFITLRARFKDIPFEFEVNEILRPVMTLQRTTKLVFSWKTIS